MAGAWTPSPRKSSSTGAVSRCSKMPDPGAIATLRTLEVALGSRSYPIHIGAGLLGRRDLLQPYLSTGPVFIVTNETVAPLYLDRLRGTLGGDPGCAIVPDGEQYKT